jgi:hydrogenase maturation protease
MDEVRKIADAVLYEGYLLWPYTRSALKNQRRWTFGGVHPPAHSAAHPDDRAAMRTQCLVEGDGDVDVRVRFLHVVRRQVLLDGEPVEEAQAAGTRWLSWEEATEREAGPGPIEVPAGRERETVGEGVAVERSWRALRGRVSVADETVAPGVRRISVEVANETPFAGTREEALLQTFCSTHAILRGGPFVSLTDPPPALAEHAAACVSEGAWPVLVGPPGSRDTLLASPIILEDHPRVAPESPGDLFDGGEVDELLVLNILGLTDEERAEMRASDPRAREILERTERLSPDELLRLHGARR